MIAIALPFILIPVPIPDWEDKVSQKVFQSGSTKIDIVSTIISNNPYSIEIWTSK
jgi:hypothetical protein